MIFTEHSQELSYKARCGTQKQLHILRRQSPPDLFLYDDVGTTLFACIQVSGPVHPNPQSPSAEIWLCSRQETLLKSTVAKWCSRESPSVGGRAVPKEAWQISQECTAQKYDHSSPKDGQLKALENSTNFKGRAGAPGHTGKSWGMGPIRPHCRVPWTNHGAVSLQEHDIKGRNVQNGGLVASVDAWTASR